ncbi:EcsC family protein [Radiobacillus kanasensis]|uniref:EcsC family protein n=1 Tax=Radiobacillus kanasensis TaxID=2844358 RepID=UPI001E42ABFD|nr:EcsC family protein [Radiobacillus kanasensis]UFU00494.1 EcsC family protein [Radiobacillus kanasensis]
MDEKEYERQARKEAQRFQHSMLKKSSLLQRSSKKLQNKLNGMIPDRVHQVVTESIKRMIQLSLTSSEYIYSIQVEENWTLEKREQEVQARKKVYKKTAMMEGAGTGAGGIVLGLADFPLLLAIKMKFLFDVGQLYGYDVQLREERLFLLHVFLLAFSSDEKRQEVVQQIVAWDQVEHDDMDWKTLQLEYRDTIDLVKMLQLIPGFGAIVGAVANGRFLEQLAETAQNCYRLRMLK